VQPGTGRSRAFVRGRVVGGSTAINAMMFLRGDPTVYDAWASAGNPGWDFESVLPYFKRSEAVQGRDRRSRGNEGPLRDGRRRDHVHAHAGELLHPAGRQRATRKLRVDETPQRRPGTTASQ
jgi:choline dehydrogenase-like flavoprotein